jgi:hypothetical protein
VARSIVQDSIHIPVTHQSTARVHARAEATKRRYSIDRFRPRPRGWCCNVAEKFVCTYCIEKISLLCEQHAHERARISKVVERRQKWYQCNLLLTLITMVLSEKRRGRGQSRKRSTDETRF